MGKWKWSRSEMFQTQQKFCRFYEKKRGLTFKKPMKTFKGNDASPNACVSACNNDTNCDGLMMSGSGKGAVCNLYSRPIDIVANNGPYSFDFHTKKIVTC
jgi:hypothetical protein